MTVAIDSILISGVPSAICQRHAGANRATGLSAPHVKKTLHHPEGAPQRRALRPLVMRALNRSKPLLSAALPYKIPPPDFERYFSDTHTCGWNAPHLVRLWVLSISNNLLRKWPKC